MLCHRCGSHVPDNSESCATCGLKLAGGAGPARKRTGGPEAPFKPGDVFAGRYAIRAVLGSGPVGHVFHAHDQEMDVAVALKVINPRLVQMPEERTQFSLALRTGKKLSNPHLVRVHEEGQDQGRPFFTMQLLEGMTLRRMMEQRAAQGQRFTPKEVEPLLGQIAAALDSAHRYGPHSDLKPENIIVLPDMLKVTDYGLALGIPRLPFLQAQRLHRAGCYVAPEYVEGGELDTRMDIYSLGVLLGELLTGLTPEEGVPPELLRHDPELPPAVEALYRRAVNINLLARPKTAGEFLAEYTATLSRSRQAPRKPPEAGRAHLSLAAALDAGGPGLSTGMTREFKPPPPVPTAELPSLDAPTQLMDAMPSPTLEAPRMTTEDAVPVSSSIPTLELPRSTEPARQLPLAAAPTEQLPAMGGARNEPPVDATQPMDSAALAVLMGSSPASAPRRPAAAPAGRSEKTPVRGVSPRSSSPPPPRPAPRRARPRSVLKLVLLALVGLLVGGAGGYWLLWSLRQSEAARQGGSPGVAPAGLEGTDPAAGVASTDDCPPGMRLVSGGVFKMGTDDPGPGMDELRTTERMVRSFCIDEFEFPNQAGALPKVGVNFLVAKGECENLGKRLCTEEEWEKACKGPGNEPYPYGGSFIVERCNTGGTGRNGGALVPAGTFAGCRSGYKVADLSGNAAEWTATPFEQLSQDKTQKGGAFDRATHEVSCSARKRGEPMKSLKTVGFRCCAEVRP